MLDLTEVQAFHGQRPVLQGVSLGVRTGEIVALLGRNGAGRSLLLKAVMGLARASGSVRVAGIEMQGRPTFEIARAGVAYVSPLGEVFPALTVHQNLVLGRRRGAGRLHWGFEEVYDHFPTLRERRQAPAAVLSGGEQKMLALARALMGNPVLLLADEPTEGLAPERVALVVSVLRQLRDEGLAVLLVEHRLSVALALADRCAVLAQGQVAFQGTPAELEAAGALRQQWLGF
jgi:branched-chain amino acid transport system ATP-binding protein